MTRAVLLVLMLASCAAPRTSEAPVAPLPFRACLPLPPPLPALRTIEAVVDRADKVERVALDCSERLRRVVEAVDAQPTASR